MAKIYSKHREQPMHKEPKELKKLAEHEAKESYTEEAKEYQKGEHLKHPQLASEVGEHITNDLAYFLHHPQLAPEHKQYPPKAPKGK